MTIANVAIMLCNYNSIYSVSKIQDDIFLRLRGVNVQTHKKSSVYEKLVETSDIMSDAFELCVGHFHFMLDIFLFNLKTLDSVIKNSHIYAKIRDILTPTQTFGLLDNLTMCQTFCPTF